MMTEMITFADAPERSDPSKLKLLFRDGFSIEGDRADGRQTDVEELKTIFVEAIATSIPPPCRLWTKWLYSSRPI